MKRVAIVGATGAVGQDFRKVLETRNFPTDEYRLLASERSAGRHIDWIGGALPVDLLTPDAFKGVDLAFFSAGGSVSRAFAKHAVDAGAVVIDNSSAFRMDPDVPLVVPEINPQAAASHNGIIANPNCSTIILAVALWPLHKAGRIKRVIVATYQAASGAGAQALRELEEQTRAVLDGGAPEPRVFPVPCAFNVFSHNTAVGDDGYNVEETKMVNETRKIFGDDTVQLAVTCMRVPVMRAHTEAVTVEFESPMTEDQARDLLAAAPGVEIIDDRQNNYFPMSLDATDRDEVLVGRLRRDPTTPDNRGLQFIVCGDQLRKGAALNAVQIGELVINARSQAMPAVSTREHAS